ncbi:LysE family translocator [Staphylococcus simulans]|uniref:LysE family translocator n=1 Tax=Staphylococcus simulans TaxID=1286 RepID=UPI001E4A0F46|nr:LysE family translocator [Staphylococcus simulans]MCD8915346.1 LysE family translocator [Staphylococcus simulans]
MDPLISFILISLLIIIIPGPDFFIVATNTMKGSTKNGIMSALGISSAHVVYSSIAALGLIFILTSSYYAFTAIKFLGAVYIAYLGVKTILNARKTSKITTSSYPIRHISLFKSFRQGFMSTILNPKAILFYISVLPQFVTKDEGSLKIIFLSALFISIVFIWFFLCSFLFTHIKKLFNQPLFKSIFDYVVGVILIGLAVSILKFEQ